MTELVREGRSQEAWFTLDACAISDCPVAIVTEPSRQLVNLIAESGMVKDSAGATFYGPDAARWPARYYDAVMVIAEEEQRVKDAADKFVRESR